MSVYLTFIGVMNLLGALCLLGALHEGFADLLLRRLCWIIPQARPYQHSDYGRLWLWWAIIGTFVFGGWNLCAASWPERFARVIVAGDVLAYGSFELLAIAGSLSSRFGPGVHVAHVLWLGQAGWGVWCLLRP